MAPIPPELSLSDEELDELMTTSWNMRVATIGPGERINLTPLWFGWAGGRVYFYCRSSEEGDYLRPTLYFGPSRREVNKQAA